MVSEYCIDSKDLEPVVCNKSVSAGLYFLNLGFLQVHYNALQNRFQFLFLNLMFSIIILLCFTYSDHKLTVYFG